MSEVQPYCQFGSLDPMAFTAHVLNISLHLLLKGLWRNGRLGVRISLASFIPFCSLYVHTH